jgi:putative phosphonoacetaldehyde dehydrogenase
MENALQLKCLVAGTPVKSDKFLAVKNPYNGNVAGKVELAGKGDVEEAIKTAWSYKPNLTRFQRHQILDRTRQLVESRSDELARTITSEAGLCLRETRYEIGRVLDVLRFASMEALRDDGEIFSGDVSPHGKARKIFSLREPMKCALAITPFNHPLNQVAHKVAPAIAAGTPLILKPSEKTPLVALKFAALLYEAGLPGPMLSVLLGPTDEVAEPLVRDARVDLVSFTGSVAVGKKIAQTAGYKKLILELGGNDPLIVLDDADMKLAVELAAEGSFRNSGQRCTAVKRILVHEKILDEFTSRLVEKTREYICGDPLDEKTRVGTVIDEAAAMYLETVVKESVTQGAKILIGGNRRGAQIDPTVIGNVPRDCRMVVSESFGPLAPIIRIKDLDDGIDLANATAYGLSCGIVTNSLSSAIRTVKEMRSGMVNINDIPAYRTETSPFGGIKDSGLGIKEGVIEAIKCFTTVKTFSLPWA